MFGGIVCGSLTEPDILSTLTQKLNIIHNLITSLQQIQLSKIIYEKKTSKKLFTNFGIGKTPYIFQFHSMNVYAQFYYKPVLKMDIHN